MNESTRFAEQKNSHYVPILYFFSKKINPLPLFEVKKNAENCPKDRPLEKNWIRKYPSAAASVSYIRGVTRIKPQVTFKALFYSLTPS
jgi:hypothetical protein